MLYVYIQSICVCMWPLPAAGLGLLALSLMKVDICTHHLFKVKLPLKLTMCYNHVTLFWSKLATYISGVDYIHASSGFVYFQVYRSKKLQVCSFHLVEMVVILCCFSTVKV